ncbi:RNA polymerase factor sigma-54 [Ligilactobacillus ruminis]|uniref:RNA polymerase factor sigma-54 n=2 Tax=Ligilactobacillus ruminis TaxID=1623 RepID=UPI000B257021|nr:RNA polymerase factor sigma-54 [Ligilactobacillus ruminis]
MNYKNILKEGEFLALKQGFGQQQKQIQKLAMTQQMQQSIRILKYGSEDLHNFLSNVELENPFMIVNASHSYVTGGLDHQNEHDIAEFAVEKKAQSLYDYLMDQVKLTMRKTPIRDMVVYFISQLDQNGYLKADLEKLSKEKGIDKVLMLDALTLLQQLDPPGTGARNLQECLILQVQYDSSAPLNAEKILKEDFEDFTNRKWSKIAKKHCISIEDVQKILDYVQTLSPAPGAIYDQSEVGYIEPDLVIEKKLDGSLEVKLTKESNPEIRFKKEYYESLKNSSDKHVLDYLKEKRHEFEKIQEDVLMRGNTLLRLGRLIVERQHDFFTESNRPLKPFLLRDAAQKLQLHESTISRAVSGKYLLYEGKVMELKEFFSRAVSYARENGENVSADEIQQKIRLIVEKEDKKNPLSDQKIVDKMKEEGLKVSRRTLAKYRERLGIPASSFRKRH